ncbi:ABC transporter permease [Paludibacterium purpuratum]|uniref:ABC-2 type transport system permease protein n=1 Tax=Paludibacterium purpuratum TaxID=1144873 RepID=A0A4R7BCB7_9NEIS|nr:ABC transporter permease [Paludibacterium purpuratum]TDR81555.1 ABC-2 type transport system permease protein [Paludibacterium purpuratum]
MRYFNLSRWWSIVLKEFLQIRRDRLTLGMIGALPIIQLTLFGFAINTDPKHLKTDIVLAEQSEFTRSFISALRNTGYFDIEDALSSQSEADAALASGRAQFVISFPNGFSAQLLKDQKPKVLVEVDATDPTTTANALSALNKVAQSALKRDLNHVVHVVDSNSPYSYELMIHKRYNPEGITQYNIIPGLMGVILSMTMVMMTSLSITRERERGTLENLLAMPVEALEVISGKIIPYIIVGLIQCTTILLFAKLLFRVPFEGNMLTVYAVSLLLILANLMVGITISALARNQLQAMQMTFFYFLPSILLSGFMFPFFGMPKWAQIIGNVLPLTHFNRVIRGILLKGNGWVEIFPNVWPIMLFALTVMLLGVFFYKNTMD